MPPAPAADEGGGGMMTIDSSSVVIAARSGAISPRQLAVVAGITSPSRSTDVDDLMPSLPDGALDLHALSPAVSDATSDDSTARPPAASAKPVAAVALSFSRVTLTRPSAGTLPSGSAGGVRGRAGAVARALPAVQAAQASVETRLQAVQRRQQQQQLRLAAWEKANLAVPRPDGTGCDAEALLAQARAFRQGERLLARAKRRVGCEFDAVLQAVDPDATDDEGDVDMAEGVTDELGGVMRPPSSGMLSAVAGPNFASWARAAASAAAAAAKGGEGAAARTPFAGVQARDRLRARRRLLRLRWEHDRCQLACRWDYVQLRLRRLSAERAACVEARRQARAQAQAKAPAEEVSVATADSTAAAVSADAGTDGISAATTTATVDASVSTSAQPATNAGCARARGLALNALTRRRALVRLPAPATTTDSQRRASASTAARPGTPATAAMASATPAAASAPTADAAASSTTTTNTADSAAAGTAAATTATADAAPAATQPTTPLPQHDLSVAGVRATATRLSRYFHPVLSRTEEMPLVLLKHLAKVRRTVQQLRSTSGTAAKGIPSAAAAAAAAAAVSAGTAPASGSGRGRSNGPSAAASVARRNGPIAAALAASAAALSHTAGEQSAGGTPSASTPAHASGKRTRKTSVRAAASPVPGARTPSPLDGEGEGDEPRSKTARSSAAGEYSRRRSTHSTSSTDSPRLGDSDGLSRSRSGSGPATDSPHTRPRRTLDIDSVIMPAGFATTRVDLSALDTKEILTPTWSAEAGVAADATVVAAAAGADAAAVDAAAVTAALLENENTSDEAYAARHQVLEKLEQRRYAEYIGEAKPGESKPGEGSSSTDQTVTVAPPLSAGSAPSPAAGSGATVRNEGSGASTRSDSVASDGDSGERAAVRKLGRALVEENVSDRHPGYPRRAFPLSVAGRRALTSDEMVPDLETGVVRLVRTVEPDASGERRHRVAALQAADGALDTPSPLKVVLKLSRPTEA